MEKRLPIVAIVGEPNAGKSTLLNKIAKQQIAVTSAVPGTTRDRQYFDTSWNGVDFTMVDTAGITYNNKQELEQELTQQIDVALDQADLILFIIDGKLDPHTTDRKALKKFRDTDKPVVLGVNKIDSPKAQVELEDQGGGVYQKLGIKNLFPISATTGRGVGDLLDRVAEELKDIESVVIEPPKGIPVSIVGKPNVGKSSIVNKILGEERVVVSDIPGTTRTAIDVQVNYKDQDYTLIDTAGMKRKQHRQRQPDIFSVFQTFKSIRRSDVVLFVIDGITPISKQDQAIAGEIKDMKKGVIIVANKIDLYQGDDQALMDYIRHYLPFLWYAPIIFTSAETGEGINEMLDMIKPIHESRGKEFEQEELDSLLEYVIKKNPPRKMRDQRTPKIYRLRHTGTHAPMFELECARPPAISQHFRKFLYKQIVKKLGFIGTPIKLQVVKKIKLFG